MADPSHIKTSLKGSRQYKDIWAGILFLFNLGINIYLFVRLGREFPKASESPRPGSDLEFPMTPEFASRFFLTVTIVCVASIGFSLACLYLMKKYPQKFVMASFVMTIFIWVSLGIFLVGSGNLGLGCAFLVVSMLECVLVYSWRHRMVVSALLLENTTKILARYPHTVLVALVGNLAGIVLGNLMVANWVFIDLHKDFTEGEKFGLAIYTAFSLFWVYQVLKNTIHVVVCGVFALHHFAKDEAVASPVTVATKNALTYSFGSICLGSLAVALIQTLRFAFGLLRDDNSFVGACFDCMIRFIESLIEYFNYFAFTEVAIFGKSYIEAAKDTWSLVKRSGLDVVINDNLLSNVIFIIVMVTGLFSGAVGFLATLPGAHLETSQKGLIVAFSALFGFMTMGLIAETIHSGVTATFVCYCEDPDTLKDTSPELYNRLHAANQPV